MLAKSATFRNVLHHLLDYDNQANLTIQDPKCSSDVFTIQCLDRSGVAMAHFQLYPSAFRGCIFAPAKRANPHWNVSYSTIGLNLMAMYQFLQYAEPNDPVCVQLMDTDPDHVHIIIDSLKRQTVAHRSLTLLDLDSELLAVDSKDDGYACTVQVPFSVMQEALRTLAKEYTSITVSVETKITQPLGKAKKEISYLSFAPGKVDGDNEKPIITGAIRYKAIRCLALPKRDPSDEKKVFKSLLDSKTDQTGTISVVWQSAKCITIQVTVASMFLGRCIKGTALSNYIVLKLSESLPMVVDMHLFDTVQQIGNLRIFIAPKIPTDAVPMKEEEE